MKTKTMYVCKADLDNHKKFIVSEVKEGRQHFEVQISWQEQELAKLKEENEKLREYLDEILTYAQYPSSKIAKEALGE